jgi:hypothetical protein
VLTRLDTYFYRPWKAGKNQNGHLVVIGRSGLDGDAIAEAVRG